LLCQKKKEKNRTIAVKAFPTMTRKKRATALKVSQWIPVFVGANICSSRIMNSS
jgi:hypothetical protein